MQNAVRLPRTKLAVTEVVRKYENDVGFIGVGGLRSSRVGGSQRANERRDDDVVLICDFHYWVSSAFQRLARSDYSTLGFPAFALAIDCLLAKARDTS